MTITRVVARRFTAFVVGLLALVGTLVVPGRASAQVSVEVSPLRVELQAGPGSTTTQPVTLTNYGKEAVRVRATLTDWDLTKDGTPQFEGAVIAGPYSATAWLRLAPPEQVIEPGASATVRFSAALPAVVEPGGYRTGILFEFEPASGAMTSPRRELAFKSRIATLIYVNAGTPPAVTELVDVRVRPTTDGVDIVATVKNSGRRTVRTRGTLVLFDAAGAIAREAAVPDVPLLPESEREVAIPVTGALSTSAGQVPSTGSGQVPVPLAPGLYRAELKLDLGLPAIIIGETPVRIPR
jgi:P pilus assembly chaperone PapD